MALLQTAQALGAGNPVIQDIINVEVIKMISPPEDTNKHLAKIGASETPGYTVEEDMNMESGAKMIADRMENNIYGGEIQDKGVTTNDPIARQLIMQGIGR
jgi:hypothetical protein